MDKILSRAKQVTEHGKLKTIANYDFLVRYISLYAFATRRIMIKSKADSKIKPKTIVSTSALFKHIQPRPCSKENAYKGHSKLWKVEKGFHKSSMRKRRPTPEHPLAVAFTGYFPEAPRCRLVLLLNQVSQPI